MLAIVEIEHEHAMLAERLARLRDLLACAPGQGRCEACDALEVADCWDAHTEFLGELLDLMHSHFRVEEAAMRRLDATPAEQEADAAHVEAHADMMERAVAVVSLAKLQEERVAARDLLENWLREHIDSHDVALLRRLRRATGAVRVRPPRPRERPMSPGHAPVPGAERHGLRHR
jgi:hemerythrin